MKITERQLLVLLQTTQESTTIADPRGLVFSFTHETRQKITQEVLNQQTAILETEK